MPGSIVALTDQGTMRLEASVARRGVDPVVKVNVFDIGLENFWTNASGPVSLSQARSQSQQAELELDPHEWAQFVQWVGHVNMKLHRESVAIACEQDRAQNVTEHGPRFVQDSPMVRSLRDNIDELAPPAPAQVWRDVPPLPEWVRDKLRQAFHGTSLEDDGPPACAQDIEPPEAA